MNQPFTNDRPRPYRARDGMILGVCKGIARSRGIDVTLLRLGVVAVFLFTGFWPICILYFVAAMLMKPEPVLPLETPGDAEFYSSFTSSRPMALQRLKATFDRLDRRIGRMESIITERGFDWEQRLRGEKPDP